MQVVEAVGASPKEHASSRHRAIESNLGCASQGRRLRLCGAGAPARFFGINFIAGHADQGHLQTLKRGQQAKNFLSFSASRERHHRVASHHHPQITMHRFNWMHKQGRRPGRIQRGRDLAGDDPTLPHPRDHDPALAVVDQFHRAIEGIRHRSGNAISQDAQRLRLNAHDIFADMFHGRNEDVSTPSLQKWSSAR